MRHQQSGTRQTSHITSKFSTASRLSCAAACARNFSCKGFNFLEHDSSSPSCEVVGELDDIIVQESSSLYLVQLETL